LNSKESWEKTRHIIQTRQLEALPELTTKSASFLRAEVFKCINTARDNKILAITQANLYGLIKTPTKPEYGQKVTAIMVGNATKNFGRDPEQPHIRRKDGAWFDFSILVDQTKQPSEIIGFDFEIRFPENCSVAFLRYDMNTPGHQNETMGLRFHIHPGSDDLMIHSGPLTPIEILQQFLYGLPIPIKPRTTGK
jgi:hypothetical protein